MKMFKKEEGFTLIELMVVVLIIGILVAIAIPVFNGAKANAAKRSCFANERTVEGSARAYEASEGALPDTVDDLVDQNYLKAAPKCPNYSGSGDTWESAYTWSGGDTGTGTLTCNVGDAALQHGHF